MIIENDKEKRSAMRIKKMVTVIMALAMLTSSGCGAVEEEEPQATPTIHIGESGQQENDADISEQNSQAENDTPQEEDTQTEKNMELDMGWQDVSEMEYLPGKVREIGDDSVIISRTFVEEDEQGFGAQVYIPEKGSADEELVTVRYTDDTKFEYWAIKGGGEEIDRREASFSDITTDAGVEAYGYYEGDVFIAQRVIIEMDV